MRPPQTRLALLAAVIAIWGSMTSGSPVPRPGLVLRVREASPAEESLAEAKREAEAINKPKSSFGPDSSRLFVENDPERHPHVYFARRGQGSPDTLFGSIASEAERSPDGKLAAAIVFHSTARPWCLTVEDLRTKEIREGRVRAHVTRYAWAPDSRHVVAQGYSLDTKLPILVVLDAMSGACTVLDTLHVVTDYGFSWSPDSRFVAASVPTAITADEDICAADLWIMSREGKRKRRLLQTPNMVEVRPRWLDQQRIAFSSYHCDEDGAGPDTLKVVELTAPP